LRSTLPAQPRAAWLAEMARDTARVAPGSNGLDAKALLLHHAVVSAVAVVTSAAAVSAAAVSAAAVVTTAAAALLLILSRAEEAMVGKLRHSSRAQCVLWVRAHA
jgi:hypothetical protein